MLAEASDQGLPVPLPPRASRPTNPRSAVPFTRQELERAARSLPESELRSVILATLTERLPTRLEALAWIAALQRHRSEGSHGGCR